MKFEEIKISLCDLVGNFPPNGGYMEFTDNTKRVQIKPYFPEDENEVKWGLNIHFYDLKIGSESILLTECSYCRLLYHPFDYHIHFRELDNLIKILRNLCWDEIKAISFNGFMVPLIKIKMED
jgi:hypothetical protein